MFEIDGYFDESGTHDGSDVVVVAGFTSHASMWKLFERRWKDALANWALPYFRMSRFANKAPGYEWPEDVRQERLEFLISTIMQCMMGSYGVALPKKSFERIFSKQAKTFVGGPYGFAARQCMLLAALDAASLPFDTAVSFTFEDGVQGERGDVLSVSFDAISNAAPQARPPVFADKRKVLQLQAADILAYELYKDYPNQKAGKASHQRMPLRMLGMAHDSRTCWKFMHEDDLERFASSLETLVARRAAGLP